MNLEVGRLGKVYQLNFSTSLSCKACGLRAAFFFWRRSEGRFQDRWFRAYLAEGLCFTLYHNAFMTACRYDDVGEDYWEIAKGAVLSIEFLAGCWKGPLGLSLRWALSTKQSRSAWINKNRRDCFASFATALKIVIQQHERAGEARRIWRRTRPASLEEHGKTRQVTLNCQLKTEKAP